MIIMKNINQLLEDLYRLGKMDGFVHHQFCYEDDYDAEKWLQEISKIANEYNIRIPNYSDDYEAWEKPIDLNDVVKTIIQNEIYLLIDEKK